MWTGNARVAAAVLAVLLAGVSACSAKVIYVDADATGANNGSSWADAYKYLQDALADANSAGKPVEICAAQGVYTPDRSGAEPNGTRDREATFQLINGVTLKGGYAGFGYPDPNARDIEAHETILSGDLADNDVDFANPVDLYDDPTWSENSYHVVTGSGTDATAVLDGFTITAGNANAVCQYDKNAIGGGMYNKQGSPALANCTFIHNLTLWKGSAIYNEASNPTLTNCTFTGNRAELSGGGMANSSSNPILTNCTFSDNSTGYIGVGGGMANGGGEPILTNCTFTGNSAGTGAGMSNSGSPTLINCTFSGNRAFFWGGGIDNSGSATLINCTFSGNRATIRWGGGMYNHGDGTTMTNCTFSGNQAGDLGGGMYNHGASPTLTKCTFSSNSAEEGGGVSIRFYSSPIFISCTFAGNRAEIGGGMANCYGNSLALTNCTFTGNSAAEDGGAMYNYGAHQTAQALITNCTFTGNSAPNANALFCESYKQPSNLQITNCILWDGDNEISNNDGSDVTITYSDVQGGWPGEGNIDADPFFVQPGDWDANGSPDDPWDDFWLEGDYHLLAGSPCIDAGDNSAVPPSVVVDLDGNARFVDDPATVDTGSGTAPIVDMGAYEGPNQGFLLSTRSITISEGNTAAFTVALAMDPFGPVNVMVAVESGDPDISRDSQGALTFDSWNFSVPQMIRLAAAQDGDNLNGSALIRISAADLLDAVVTAYEQDDDPVSDILFVDANATGENNGSNWVDAYPDLQVALSIAHTHPNVEQIRVAQGVYTPAEPNGNRSVSFTLLNNVAIKGGYAGVGALDPNERDFELYETILSGDLNGDDGPDFANNDENSHHVFCHPEGTDLDNTAILDGFTITGGNANINDTSHRGYGGGMYNYRCSPTVKNCIFSGNFAIFGGGGMENYYDSSPSIANCIFSGNSSHTGGGMLNTRSSCPTITNCTFSDNYASYSSGGMFNAGSSPIVTNCIFADNYAGYYGAMEITESSFPIVTNCTFSGNTARRDGGGIGIRYSSSPAVTSCIFWGNTPDEIFVFSATPVITYSDVQGGWPGEGNIDANPCFVSLGYWDSNGVWIDGDYHLLPDSPCIDAGADGGVYTDIEGNVRPFDFPEVENNGELPDFDMGAYEGTIQTEANVRIVPRVINRRGRLPKILAVVRLPEGVSKDEIDLEKPLMLYPGGIKAMRQYAIQSGRRGSQHTTVFASFNKAELMNAVPENGRVELRVFGLFETGQYFYGTDTVTIIGRIGQAFDSSWLEITSGQWLQSGPDLDADLDDDGNVNFKDFAFMALHWLEEH